MSSYSFVSLGFPDEAQLSLFPVSFLNILRQFPGGCLLVFNAFHFAAAATASLPSFGLFTFLSSLSSCCCCFLLRLSADFYVFHSFLFTAASLHLSFFSSPLCLLINYFFLCLSVSDFFLFTATCFPSSSFLFSLLSCLSSIISLSVYPCLCLQFSPL